MKQFLLLCALYFSIFAKAQQDTNYTANNVAFALDTGTEHIDILLPKASQVQQGGIVIIDGRTYSVQTLKCDDFPIAPKYLKNSVTAEYKDLVRLTSVSEKFMMAGQKDSVSADMSNAGNQWRKMPDGEFIMAWHGYKKSAPQEQTVKFSIAKVAGASILLFTLEGYIDWRAKDFETMRMMMYKVLDDAVYTENKALRKM